MADNFNSKCRTCLSDSNYYHQLSDYVDENCKILEMLDSCVPHLDAKNSLQFSNLMCQPCVDKLLNAYKFQEMCIKSNEQLTTLLIKTEPEEILVQMTDKLSFQIKYVIDGQSDDDYKFLPEELMPEAHHYSTLDQGNPQKEVSGTVCHNSWLKQHTVTHSNERPFQCTHCDKSFNSERYLKCHLQIHNKKAAEDKLTKDIDIKTTKLENDSDISSIQLNKIEKAKCVGKRSHKKRKQLPKRLQNLKNKDTSVQPNPCKNTKCGNSCGDKFSESDRIQINKEFWGLDNKIRQKYWLISCIKRFSVKRRYSKNSKRLYSYNYFLNINNNTFKVCQQFLLKTLHISQMMLKYTRNKTIPHNK